MPNVAVIYYSATGNVYKLAEAIAAGARDTQLSQRIGNRQAQCPGITGGAMTAARVGHPRGMLQGG